LLARVAVALVAIVLAAAPAHACADRIGVSRIVPIGEIRPFAPGRQVHEQIRLGPKEVVLTLDDGPDPDVTERVLAVLAKHCVKATFFQIGRRMATRPDLVRRVRAEGHTIGTHSWSHFLNDWLPYFLAFWDIQRPVRYLHELTGERPIIFRHPRGRRTPDLDRIVDELGLVYLANDVVTGDWDDAPPEQSFRRFLTGIGAKGRGVIGMHDNRANTPALLDMVLGWLTENGFKIVHLQADAPPSFAPPSLGARKPLEGAIREAAADGPREADAP